MRLIAKKEVMVAGGAAHGILKRKQMKEEHQKRKVRTVVLALQLSS
jgi:hypothetical protein